MQLLTFICCFFIDPISEHLYTLDAISSFYVCKQREGQEALFKEKKNDYNNEHFSDIDILDPQEHVSLINFSITDAFRLYFSQVICTCCYS